MGTKWLISCSRLTCCISLVTTQPQSQMIVSTIVIPVIEKLQKSVEAEKIKRLEAENAVMVEHKVERDILKVELEKSNARKRASDCIAETETAKRRALEQELANRPKTQNRTGCAAVYMERFRENAVRVSVRYTDQRSMTLEKSSRALPICKGDKEAVLKLYGAIRPIDIRDVFEAEFKTRGTKGVDFTSEKEVWDRLSGTFMDRVKDGFAIGIKYSGTVREVAFYNGSIIRGMPQEDLEFCRHMLNCQ